MVPLLFSSEGTEALFKDLAALRMFCLFSTLGLALHPFRGRSQIYTGSPRVGKAPNEAASHGREQPPLLLN